MGELSKNINYTGLPLFWVGIIDPDGDDPDNVEWLYGFRKAQKVGYKINPLSAQGTGDTIDITDCDGSITRFPKSQRIISGVDETEMTDPTKDVEATGKAEVSLTANSAPYKWDAAATPSPAFKPIGWTAFIKDLKSVMGKKLLVVFPTGQTYDGLVVQSTKKADGWGYMIGKLSSGIEQELSGTPSSLAMTFVSYLDSTSGLKTAIETLLTSPNIPSLKIYGGGGSKDIAYTPDAVTDASLIVAGDMLLNVDTPTF